jgi:hypothetical protein
MTFAIEFTAWRRVGFERNELRLGWVTLWWLPGSVSNEMSRARAALADAAQCLSTTKGNTQ